MTEAMPFLQKAILLSYDPWPFYGGSFSSNRIDYLISRILNLIFPFGVSAITTSFTFRW